MKTSPTNPHSSLLAALDDDQRAAVVAPPGPVCVLAGAGTGKTRTITHRIAHLIASGRHQPGEILAVTFTTRAAGEMRLRLRGLGADGVQARTFHSAALRQLRFFWRQTIGGDMWPVLEHKLRLVSVAAKRAGADTDTALLRDLASEIEWAKASLIAPEDYITAVGKLQRDTPVAAQIVAQTYELYEELKRGAEQLDFDDILLHIAAVLENDEDVARTFRAQYRCFVVDEYQDVTPLQQRVLTAWLGGRDNLTVVGDANQTIYAFAGASPRYLLDFERTYPGAQVLRLQRDYRSTPQIVALANKVIAAASGDAARLRLTLQAVLPDGPPATFDEYDDEPAEAAAIAARAASLIESGTPASSIAVLYRINAQSEVFENALAEAQVPYVVRGGERFFARVEVRQAMAALRAAATSMRNDDDHAEASDLAAGDPAAEGENTPDGARETGAGEVGPSSPLVSMVRRVLEPIGLTVAPPAPGALRDRWDALTAVVSAAEELAVTDARADLRDFVAELEQRAEAQFAPTMEGVTLASLHAAKGLEWDVVFLAGLTDGTVPIQHADTPESVEEERRLFYVGITRARTRLHLSWALARHAGGRRSRRASRFLTGLLPEDGRRRRRSSRRCRVCAAPLASPAEIKSARCADCPSTADPELVAALKSWRKETASAASVPAFVVFSDATLMAIAERRPIDNDSLLDIPGIGRHKLDRYGRDVIAIVTETSQPTADSTA